ncbi:hypothetical protein OG785_36815 [Streptomyces sp. NBC_00006]|uniref:hypothetical protein n=1 Tax=unclassified Streptomyces TaxID=2593676 RepID=UPI002253BCE5|nr:MULTISPECIES: hypothetical protein [unclassified Streptomyces]MCX4831588.1 hypothetical protein [Streptomyces sp. NBC_01016]MCX5536106.1 hypothetical protein [Streptomyces sp. NBC_00006]
MVVHRTKRSGSALVTRVIAVLATAWLCGAPSAAAIAAPLAVPADACAYASVDGGSSGDAVAVSGSGVICRAGPSTPPPKKPAPKPPPPKPAPPPPPPPPPPTPPPPPPPPPPTPTPTPTPPPPPPPAPEPPPKPQPKPTPTHTKPPPSPKPVHYPAYRPTAHRAPPRGGPSLVTLTLLITAPAVLAVAALRPR